MKTKSCCWFRIAFGILFVTAGALCLNYTNGFGLEHHAQWARSHGLPVPTYPIFLSGVVLVLFGGMITGHVIGTSRASNLSGGSGADTV